MRRTPLRKEGKQKISVVQRKLWELCKQIIRKRYGNSCYTCGASGLMGSNWHTGHLWAKASLGASLKYDLRILRPQCYKCNIHHGGAGAVFYASMLANHGEKYMRDLERDKQVSVKALDHYLSLIDEYQKIVDNEEGIAFVLQ